MRRTWLPSSQAASRRSGYNQTWKRPLAILVGCIVAGINARSFAAAASKVPTFRAHASFRRGTSWRRASDPLQLGVADMWQSYEQLLDTQAVATDVATAATLNAASDMVAQTAETMSRRIEFSGSRALRYAAFGSLDGFVGHHWFEFLDVYLPRTGNGFADTCLKVLADSLVYTPCWCVVFLFVMACMEGRGPRTALEEVRRDFWELLKGNYGITLPFVALIYGVIPVRFQVAGFALLTLAYTIVLSLWANARPASSGSSL